MTGSDVGRDGYRHHCKDCQGRRMKFGSLTGCTYHWKMDALKNGAIAISQDLHFTSVDPEMVSLLTGMDLESAERLIGRKD